MWAPAPELRERIFYARPQGTATEKACNKDTIHSQEGIKRNYAITSHRSSPIRQHLSHRLADCRYTKHISVWISVKEAIDFPNPSDTSYYSALNPCIGEETLNNKHISTQEYSSQGIQQMDHDQFGACPIHPLYPRLGSSGRRETS